MSLSVARNYFRKLVPMRGTDTEKLELYCSEATCTKNAQLSCFLSETADDSELVLSLRVKLLEFDITGQTLCDELIQQYFTPHRIKFTLRGLKLPMCRHIGINADRISPTYESAPTLYSELCKKCRLRGVATGCEIEAYTKTKDGKSLVTLWIIVLRNVGSLDSSEEPGWQLHTTKSCYKHMRSTRDGREEQWKEWVDLIEHVRLLWTMKLKQSPSATMIPKPHRFTRRYLNVLSQLCAKRANRLVDTGKSLQNILDDLQETKNRDQQHRDTVQDPAPTGAKAGGTVTWQEQEQE